MKKLIIFIFYFLNFSTIDSQVQNLKDTINLNSVILTANRTEQYLNSVGRSVQIISKEEIQSSGVLSFTELLANHSSVFSIGSNQTPGQIHSLTGRGANTNQSNILIDGVRLSNASSTDNIVDLSELSLSHIERIEIIRGNMSSLFGSSSIGTTINIITTKPSRQGIQGSQFIRYGNLGKNTSLVDQNLNLAYETSRGLYSTFSFYSNQTRGINATLDTISDENNYKFMNSDQDDFKKREIWLKSGIKKTNWNAFLLYRNNHQASDLDKGAFRDDDNYNSNSKRNSLITNFNYNITNKLSTSLNAGISRLRYMFTDDSSWINSNGITDHTFVDGNYKTTSYNADILLTHKSKHIRNTLGLYLNKEGMGFNSYLYINDPTFGKFEALTSLDSSLYSILNYAVYINSDINLGIIKDNLSRFNLNLSLRNTYNSAFRNFLSFELNPYYQLSEHIICFMNLSNSFVAPSIYQLYSPDQSAFNGITRGNPFLLPERSNSFEIGLRNLKKKAITYNLSFYVNSTKNNIDFVYLWNPNKGIDSLDYTDYQGDSYINLGRRLSQGIEGTISYELSSRLNFTINFNFVKGTIKYNSPDLDSLHIGNRSVQLYNSGFFLDKNRTDSRLARKPSTLNLSCIYNFTNKISSGILYRYIGKRNDVYYEYNLGPFGALSTQQLRAVGIVDLKFQYQICNYLNLLVRLENIMNTNYSDILGYANRGRSIYGQFSVSF